MLFKAENPFSYNNKEPQITLDWGASIFFNQSKIKADCLFLYFSLHEADNQNVFVTNFFSCKQTYK